jgi:hypothetical protein
MNSTYRLRACSSLALVVLALGIAPIFGQGDERKHLDRLLRVLPVGEAPPFMQKIVNGVRQEQAAPKGSIPPREVVQMTPNGEQEGVPLRLSLDRLSVSIPVRAGPLSLHEVGQGLKRWHTLTVPAKTTHALAVLWRDPVEKKWSKARSMTLADDVTSFPAGNLRLVNVSPWPAIVKFKGKSYKVAPYKTARLRGGVLQQIPVKVQVQDNNGKLVTIFNTAVSQQATERTNLIIYRADGRAPRRPAKVRLLREPARLPPPPRPREG